MTHLPEDVPLSAHGGVCRQSHCRRDRPGADPPSNRRPGVHLHSERGGDVHLGATRRAFHGRRDCAGPRRRVRGRSRRDAQPTSAHSWPNSSTSAPFGPRKVTAPQRRRNRLRPYPSPLRLDPLHRTRVPRDGQPAARDRLADTPQRRESLLHPLGIPQRRKGLGEHERGGGRGSQWFERHRVSLPQEIDGAKWCRRRRPPRGARRTRVSGGSRTPSWPASRTTRSSFRMVAPAARHSRAVVLLPAPEDPTNR